VLLLHILYYGRINVAATRFTTSHAAKYEDQLRYRTIPPHYSTFRQYSETTTIQSNTNTLYLRTNMASMCDEFDDSDDMEVS
jgi:hypothetical protein